MYPFQDVKLLIMEIVFEDYGPFLTNDRLVELCGGIHTALRQIPTQIPIGFCVNLSVSVSVSM